MAQSSQRYGRSWCAAFALDPSLIHANHGSYGGVPDAVRRAQREIRRELDANPTGFLRDEYPLRIRAAAARVAGFLGGQAQDWVFVENATAAVNCVISSFPLAEGDAILTTDHVYGAVRKTIARRCAQTGAQAMEAHIPLPVTSPEQVFDLVTAAATPNTRLVVLDHITSPSAIVFPVAELCAHFRAKGIAVLVDGAHAPGSLDVDVEAIGADYYTGNAHKWLCAPRGAAVMWCRRDRQQGLEPLAASHGVNDGFTAAFDWPGTRDPSAWLSIPAAIDFHEAAGAADLRQRNHDVIVTAAQQLAKKLGTVLAAPPDMLASMAAIRLWPDRPLTGPHCAELQRRMQGEQGVVAAFNTVGGTTWMRLSAAIYTETDDLLEAGRRIWRATRKLD